MHYSENETWVLERQRVAEKQARKKAFQDSLKNMTFVQRAIAHICFLFS